MRRNQNRVMTTLIAIAIATCLSACEGKQVGATVTGLNYRDDEIRFFITDPENDKNGAGGEDFLPYSVGGQLCCYSLPAKWHKGLRVKLDVETAGGVMKDGGGKEAFEADREARRKAGRLYQSALLEIPEYHTRGTPTLWVQFLPGDRYTAIVSDVGPRDDAWPSEVKGWPEPTLAYQQKLWRREMKQAESNLKAADQLIREYERPLSTEQLQQNWKHYSRYYKGQLEGLNGYSDPRFISILRQGAQDFKQLAQRNMDTVSKSEPK